MSTDSTKHTQGWPKTPYQMLERIEKRWLELEDREISNYDFRCLMSDVSQFVYDYKTFEPEILSALKAAEAHIAELREAWQRGALDERDGQDGTRSNRNIDVHTKLLAAISKAEEVKSLTQL